MSVILKAENISKQYRLGLVGTGTLSDDLKRWWYTMRGREDPFLKLGAVNDRGAKANQDYVWALKDINFEVKQGEVLGIIGKNGAGKSTLLKLLSRVTAPTTGSIKTRGRIASLLEIGTGFHPELTGRENIFMNGAVLGMTKSEIKRKLDEIIAFSGCEMYIDTPVKRYSSGMTVRLGFAVAAHLEPEILVVDEVLAVGDAEFQKKAIGKMQDLSTGEGRTVIFVSHNMVSIQQLCSRCLLLVNGVLQADGGTQKILNEYLRLDEVPNKFKRRPLIDKIMFLKDAYLLSDENEKLNVIQSGKDFNLILKIEARLNFNDVIVEIGLDGANGERLVYLSNVIIERRIKCIEGKNLIKISVKKFPLVPGSYSVTVRLSSKEWGEIDRVPNSFLFRVEEGDFYNSGKFDGRSGKFLMEFDISKSQ